MPLRAFLTLSTPGPGCNLWSLLAMSPIFIIVFGSVLHLMSSQLLLCCRRFVRCHCFDLLSPVFLFAEAKLKVISRTLPGRNFEGFYLTGTRTLWIDSATKKESSIWQPQSDHSMCEIDTTDGTATNGNANNFTLHLLNDQKPRWQMVLPFLVSLIIFWWSRRLKNTFISPGQHPKGSTKKGNIRG